MEYISWPVERLPDVMPHSSKVRPVAMFEAVQEIAIYIHRFHNLDLFHQGYTSISIFFPNFVTKSWLTDMHNFFYIDGIRLKLP